MNDNAQKRADAQRKFDDAKKDADQKAMDMDWAEKIRDQEKEKAKREAKKLATVEQRLRDEKLRVTNLRNSIRERDVNQEATDAGKEADEIVQKQAEVQKNLDEEKKAHDEKDQMKAQAETNLNEEKKRYE